jgi:hypothetical protein
MTETKVSAQIQKEKFLHNGEEEKRGKRICKGKKYS